MSVLEDARVAFIHLVDGIQFGGLDADWRGLHFEVQPDTERVDVVCQHGVTVVTDALGDEPDEADCTECDALCCDRCTRNRPCDLHPADYDDGRVES